MRTLILFLIVMTTGARALKTEIVSSNNTQNGKNVIVVKKVTGYTLSPSNITEMIHQAFITSNLVDVSAVESLLKKMEEDYRGSSGLSKTSQAIQTLLRSLYNDTTLSSQQKMTLLLECWQLSYLERVKRFNLDLIPENKRTIAGHSAHVPMAVSAAALKLFRQIYTDETADPVTRAQAYHYTSQIYKNFYRREEADRNLLKAEELYKAADNTRGLYEVNFDLAVNCQNKREFDKSVKYFFKATEYGKVLPEIDEYEPLRFAFETYVYDEKYDEAIALYDILLKEYKYDAITKYNFMYEGAKKNSKFKFSPSYYLFYDYVSEIPGIRPDWKEFTWKREEYMAYVSGLLDELIKADSVNKK